MRVLKWDGITLCGEFVPETLSRNCIEAGLVPRFMDIVAHLGINFIQGIDLREPSFHAANWSDDRSINKWHRDSSAVYDAVTIVWASSYPTWVRNSNHIDIFCGRPYQLVAIDNSKCLHRRPLMPNRHNRWFGVARGARERGRINESWMPPVNWVHRS